VESTSPDQLKFNGGFAYSWARGLAIGRSGHAQRPFGRLWIDRQGVEVTFRGVFGRVANPHFSRSGKNRISWQQVEKVQAARGLLPIPGNVGVRFYGDRRLVFWCSPTARTEILQAAQRFAPSTVHIDTDAKYVFRA
jgi:hypothetical protein